MRCSEQQLLRKMIKGDTAAFEELMYAYENYVAAIIVNQAGGLATHEDAEELISNVFCSLWKHRAELRSDNIKGWLAAAARNEALSFMRRRRIETVDIDDCVILGEDSAEAAVSRAEMSAVLDSTLNVLDERSREIFVRRFYLGQSVSAIADVMSVNLSTVKSCLYRGKEKLRAELIRGGYGCEN